MIFYKITAIPKQIEIPEEESDKQRWAMKLRPVSRKFTDACKRNATISICEAEPDQFILAAVIEAEYVLKHCPTELAERYLAECGFSANITATEEIGCSELGDLLDLADKESFIYSKSQFLDTRNIDIGSRRGFHKPNDRIITGKMTAQSLRQLAWRNLCDTDLNPEIDRICGPASELRNILQHPVHYLFRFDIEECVQPIVEGTLSLLREKKRLISARYFDFSVTPFTDSSDLDLLRSMYETLGGGAAVIRFFGIGVHEDEYMKPSESVVIKTCELALEFHKKVLTIFCLDKADEKNKTIIYGCMGEIPLVEISTSAVDYKTARKHLAAMARENQLTPDNALYAKLADRNADPASVRSAFYNGNDLKKSYESWYHLTLKTKIYPQYASISASRAIAAKAPPKGSAYDELERMIGLTEAKKVITDALNYFKIQKLYNTRGIVGGEHPSMHMVFTGNPGTAKTTAARLFARIMKENNLLSVGEIVEVGRADLVGKYVGWTAKIVREKFKAAKGSVLFIDEAYSLVDDKNGLYGDEAINTIVQEMENQREDMVVIFAGYPDKMSEFLTRNPGLRSRIAFHVPFPDYTPFELYAIFELMCEKQKIRIGEGAKEKLYRVFESAQRQPDFGNGRFVRNLLESAKLRQASRLVKTDCGQITDNDLLTLIPGDFEYAPQAPCRPQKAILGFCG
ncbi:MAG TPA: AAA family ATPase [Oscillospiraceae bacterium]|nr:AAA family ATPase [Oscillospiraceae bacterium]HPS36024.1 AAA family ATPase [Oscillospiraceae bacterium]